MIKKLFFITLNILLLYAPVAQAKFPAEIDGKPLPSLADMLERITPAVVNISTEEKTSKKTITDPVLQHYFGEKLGVSSPKKIGAGSGVIIDSQYGYIVTNTHVLEGAGDIVVTLHDNRRFFATVVGKDKKADLAVIRIVPEDLTQISLANSKELRVGDFAVAIGNTYGLGQSVSSGIVSGLGRTGLGIEDYEDFIQTDATINPGNSGGALVNLNGELIGVNTAILGGINGSNVGVGFAIPANMVDNISNQLIRYGKVERGQLGIEIQDLRPELSSKLNLPKNQGAFISGVVNDSPADIAGMKKGDIVVGVNGWSVKNSSSLKTMIGNLRIGSKVSMEYYRDGEVKKGLAVIGKNSTDDIQDIESSKSLSEYEDSLEFLDNESDKSLYLRQ